MEAAWWWTPREFLTMSDGTPYVDHSWEALHVPTMVHLFDGNPWDKEIPTLCGRYPYVEDESGLGTVAQYPRRFVPRCRTCLRVEAARKVSP